MDHDIQYTLYVIVCSVGRLTCQLSIASSIIFNEKNKRTHKKSGFQIASVVQIQICNHTFQIVLSILLLILVPVTRTFYSSSSNLKLFFITYLGLAVDKLTRIRISHLAFHKCSLPGGPIIITIHRSSEALISD